MGTSLGSTIADGDNNIQSKGIKNTHTLKKYSRSANHSKVKHNSQTPQNKYLLLFDGEGAPLVLVALLVAPITKRASPPPRDSF